MGHKSVVQLINDTVKSLSDNIQFGYGRRSDFDVIKSKSFPMIWLLPLTANPSYVSIEVENYQKTWNVIILFLQADEAGSDEDDYKPILDEMDDLVDKFVNRLNDFYLKGTDEVGPLTLRNINQTPFFKSDASINTGWLVSFQMVVSDSFEYCSPDNIVLYGRN